ncbi:17117_t:CDS:1, partial [Funneliformis geosporum]
MPKDNNLMPIEVNKKPFEEVSELKSEEENQVQQLQNKILELERKLETEITEKENLKEEFLEALEKLEESITSCYACVGLSKKAKDELADIDKPRFVVSVAKNVANTVAFGSGSFTVAGVKKVVK